jgi:hypothetical protein
MVVDRGNEKKKIPTQNNRIEKKPEITLIIVPKTWLELWLKSSPTLRNHPQRTLSL